VQRVALSQSPSPACEQRTRINTLLWKQSANNNCCNTECFSAIDTALHSITHWIVTSLLFCYCWTKSLCYTVFSYWKTPTVDTVNRYIFVVCPVKRRWNDYYSLNLVEWNLTRRDWKFNLWKKSENTTILVQERFLFFLEWNLLFWNEIHSEGVKSHSLFWGVIPR